MKSNGRFGEYGGIYVPEVLFRALEELEQAFLTAVASESFNRDLRDLWQNYAGRPTALYRCRRLVRQTQATIYLKREDLLHGGAHKTNQVLGQGLLAQRIGKKRIIAETGAGQHGVATAIVGALLGFQTRIYMGEKDMERQKPNVFRMRILGAEVVPVTRGTRTLKDAINEALRDWAASIDTTHYMLGTAAGPHPFPTMVRTFQQIIGQEAREQILAQAGRLPDAVIACVGGGSNAIGIFSAFLEDADVKLIGVEAGGHGPAIGEHGKTLQQGEKGVLHGAYTRVLQNSDGQISETSSVSAGLDYPGVGPQHADLQAQGRASYVSAKDHQALDAFHQLSRREGIIPALESAHAVAHAMKMAAQSTRPSLLLVNLSGRGDKDLAHVEQLTSSGGLPLRTAEEKNDPLP